MSREMKMQTILARLENATDREVGLVEAFTHGLGIAPKNNSEISDRAVLMAATTQEMYRMPLERLRCLYITAKVWTEKAQDEGGAENE